MAKPRSMRKTKAMDYRAHAFLLMPFDEELNGLRDIIKAAGKAVGVRVERADDVFQAGIIIEQIKEKIRAADVIIAVCTGQNPNVFFELGIADQWHWPILLAENESDLPFDIHQYRALIYKDHSEDLLQGLLAATIDATVDAGKKSKAAADAAAPPPRAQPRVLGHFMSQVHIWGLEREGSLEHIPVDVLLIAQDVEADINQNGRALASDFPKRQGVIHPPYRALAEAEKSGIVQRNYDPGSSDWHLVLTEKGRGFLRAYSRFLERMRQQGTEE